MKAIRILITGLIAISFVAAPAFGQDKSGKNVTYFNPPPGSYKQVSPEEARKMKNYTSSDQKEVSITLERISDKTEEGKRK